MLNAVSSQLQRAGIPATRPTAPVAPQAKPAASAAPEAQPEALGEDRVLLYGRNIALGAGGAVAGYRLGHQMADHMQEAAKALKAENGFQAALPSIQKVLGSGMRGAGISALVTGAVSAVSHGISLAQGKTDGKTVISNVISDAVSGGIGGFGGVTAAGAGNLILRSFGIAALPLTIGTVAFGAVGGVLAGKLAQKLQNSAAETAALVNSPQD